MNERSIAHPPVENPHGTHGLPWGGLLAALLLWALSSVLLGPGATWPFLRGHMSIAHPMEQGLVNDRLATARARRTFKKTPLVVVLGTSRANAALKPSALEAAAPGIEAVSFAHAGMQPFELRGLADEIEPLGADLAVLLASEFDTHRPLRLMPQTAPGSLVALRDLTGLLEPAFVWEHRTTFLQLLLSSVVPVYRYREVFAVAGASELRSFPSPTGEATSTPEATFLLQGKAPLLMHIQKELDRIATLFPSMSRKQAIAELRQCRSITDGPHADVQMELLRLTVKALRSAGTRVLLVEGPLSPSTLGYYDPSLRQEFVALALDLVQDEGVRFLPLEETGPLPIEAFRDLTHLSRPAAQEFGSYVGQCVGDILEVPVSEPEAR